MISVESAVNVESSSAQRSENQNSGQCASSQTSTPASSSSSSNSSTSMNFGTNSNQTDANNNNMTNFAKSNVDANNNNSGYMSNNNNNNITMMSTATSSESLCNDANDSSFSDFSSKTNLIVNYLPQNMTQDEIKAIFSSIGPVDSCKLIKDKLSGQSLGYAFVNYVKQEDADKAIDSLNGMRLQNKTIKVSFARPSSDSIKGANLYVCGLHKDFSQSELEKMFNQFGTIISSKILTDPKSGVSKGVGFVRFDQRIEAEVAIAKLNGKPYENSTEPLVVKFANTPTSVKSVMGLPLAPFVPTCRGFYQPFRSSSSASYRYSPMSGGYSADSSSLLHHQTSSIGGGMSSLPPHIGGGGGMSANSLPSTPVHMQSHAVHPLASLPAQTSIVAPLQAPPPPPPPVGMPSTPPTSISNGSLSSINYSGWCIFVYNLGPDTDESILWQLFGPFGAVQSVKIIRDVHSAKCKGFGFVTMTNYDEAITAINCLNGLNLQNRILQVSFKTNKQMF